MKKNFTITPVEGKKNEVKITFQKDVTITVDKKDELFIKFLMMVLHYSGEDAGYFAPLLGFTKSSFNNLKKKVESIGIKSLLLETDMETQSDKELSEPDIGKVIELIVKNPNDTNEKIADKFNVVSTSNIDFKIVEKIRKQFGLKTT